MHDVRAESPEGRHQDNVDSPRSDRRRQQYNPNAYQDEVRQNLFARKIMIKN